VIHTQHICSRKHKIGEETVYKMVIYSIGSNAIASLKEFPTTNSADLQFRVLAVL